MPALIDPVTGAVVPQTFDLPQTPVDLPADPIERLKRAAFAVGPGTTELMRALNPPQTRDVPTQPVLNTRIEGPLAEKLNKAYPPDQAMRDSPATQATVANYLATLPPPAERAPTAAQIAADPAVRDRWILRGGTGSFEDTTPEARRFRERSTPTSDEAMKRLSEETMAGAAKTRSETERKKIEYETEDARGRDRFLEAQLAADRASGIPPTEKRMRELRGMANLAYPTQPRGVNIGVPGPLAPASASKAQEGQKPEAPQDIQDIISESKTSTEALTKLRTKYPNAFLMANAEKIRDALEAAAIEKKWPSPIEAATPGRIMQFMGNRARRPALPLSEIFSRVFNPIPTEETKANELIRQLTYGSPAPLKYP